MNAGQLAALIAAGFFAIGACAFVYVLARLAKLISAATVLVTAHQARADDLVRRARDVVDRAEAQLAGSAVLAESVQQVSASMSELSEQVTAVAGTARLIAAGLGAPVLRLAAAGYGLRRALANRRLAAGGGAAGRAAELARPAGVRAITGAGRLGDPVQR
jgi:uncharacterized membrane protein YcjF (UPF0283 family)